MDQLQNLLNQVTPWGLTVGQMAIVVLGAIGLVIVWMVLAFVLRLAGTIIRIGCTLILIFSCGVVAMMVFSNVVNR